MSKEVQDLLAKKWLDRASAQGLKPKSAAFKKAELEFALGAVAALDAQAEIAAGAPPKSSLMPPSWWVAAIRGEQIFKGA